jgi:hypothetical protein
MATNEPPKPPPAHRRRIRVRLIRRRTTAAALATFALAFGLISATGSMGATSKSASTAPKRHAQAQQSSPSDQGSGPISPAPVTTRQS